MKSRIIIMILAIAVTSALTGCYKDILSPGQDPSAPPQAVSFSGDLVPIFTANCALSGCHDAVPGHRPSLTADKAYDAILSGGYVNTLVPANSIIYGEVKSGSMPPTGALRPSDIQKILDWIRNGAPNN
jgi:hypothetical protein